MRRSERPGWSTAAAPCRVAAALLHAGANLRQIQELLGHKHLDSTQRDTRVNAHELRGAIKRLRWVGERPPHSAGSEV